MPRGQGSDDGNLLTAEFFAGRQEGVALPEGREAGEGGGGHLVERSLGQ